MTAPANNITTCTQQQKLEEQQQPPTTTTASASLPPTDADGSVEDEVEELEVNEDGKPWEYRPPPRGLTSAEYSMCPR